ncbi:MAG: thiamine S protein [Humibacillus sp.]|nr:thiamine S protein [Humibacillus sp.]
MTVEQTRSAVTVRYWAAARAAAGVDAETLEVVAPTTTGAVIEAAVAAHPALGRVAAVSTFLLDGRAVGRDVAVEHGASLEVLPPFAGG